MSICRTTATQKNEGFIAHVLNTMRCSRWNANSIAHRYLKGLNSKRHQTTPLSDVIQLFGDSVLVAKGFTAHGYGSFCQTLEFVSLDARVHELTDFRAIFGDVGRNSAVGLAHVRAW